MFEDNYLGYFLFIREDRQRGRIKDEKADRNKIVAEKERYDVGKTDPRTRMRNSGNGVSVEAEG